MRLLNSPFLHWLILVLPALLWVGVPNGEPIMTSAVLAPLGVAALWLLIAALIAWPFGGAFRDKVWGRWMAGRSLVLCAAALFYGGLHHLAYYRDMREFIGAAAIRIEAYDPRYSTGYCALALLGIVTIVGLIAIFPRFASAWKWLQWLMLPATLFAAAHWYLMDGEMFLPLAHLAAAFWLWIIFVGIWLVRASRRLRSNVN